MTGLKDSELRFIADCPKTTVMNHFPYQHVNFWYNFRLYFFLYANPIYLARKDRRPGLSMTGNKDGMSSFNGQMACV